MTLLDRILVDRDLRVEATMKTYENLHKVYDGLISQHMASSLVEWCRAQLCGGLPEWLVGGALANAHMNLVAHLTGIPPNVLGRQSVFFLLEPNIRPFHDEEEAWEADRFPLDGLLDAAAMMTLARHGASLRRAGGFKSGAFVRVIKALGLFEFDVPHMPIIPAASTAP